MVPFQAYRIRLVQLVDKLLEIFERDPDYRYFMLDGQTIVLDDYLGIRPQNRAKLERYVRSGCLLIGPWYILPDEFLVSPESTIRNLLVGTAACEQFGRRMDVGNIPDPFGHISQMPQILRGFDIDVMAFWRGVSDAQNEFIWAAPDGTDILVIHQHDGYGNAAQMPTDEETFVVRTKQIVEALAPTATTPHLLAMNGSDHLEPQPELPHLISVADETLPEVEMRHGTLPQFVQAIRDAAPELVTHRGEMRSPAKAPLLPGVLSTRMGIKQRNHACETLLTSWAEPAVAFAELTHAPLEFNDQAALVGQAWRYLLQNHPHDSICGCSIDQVHREMATRFDWVEQIGEEITERNLRALASLVNTPEHASVVVFNPTTDVRTDRVAVRVTMPKDAAAIALVTEEGERIMPQLGEPTRDVVWAFDVAGEEMRAMIGYLSGGNLLGDDLHEVVTALDGDTLDLEIRVGQGPVPDPKALEQELARLHELVQQDLIATVRVLIHRGDVADCAFVAKDVPGLGYRAYGIVAAETSESAASEIPEDESRIIENADLRVEVAEDGTFTLHNKTTGMSYPGLNRFVDVGDRGDEYNFNPVEQDVRVEAPVSPPQVRRIADGPVRQTLEVMQVYRVPVSLGATRFERSVETVELPITTRITLTAGVSRVEVATTVENVASDHRLRVHFPVPVNVDTFDAEGHMDVITRSLDLPTNTADWIEQPVGTHPQRTWSDVSDGKTGLLVANRGLPEVEVLRTPTGAELALTLLRCVGWLSRGDLSVRRGHAGPGLPTPEAQCQGTYTFHYALVPHAGGWEQASREAHAFNAPFRAVRTPAHAGELPQAMGFLRVMPISPAAPDTMVVSTVKISEHGEGLILRMWNTDTEPCECAVSFWKPPQNVVRCTLGERSLGDLPIEDDGTVRVTARGREIVTMRADF